MEEKKELLYLLDRLACKSEETKRLVEKFHPGQEQKQKWKLFYETCIIEHMSKQLLITTEKLVGEI